MNGTRGIEQRMNAFRIAAIAFSWSGPVVRAEPGIHQVRMRTQSGRARLSTNIKPRLRLRRPGMRLHQPPAASGCMPLHRPGARCAYPRMNSEVFHEK
jgi:hypothetical protein